MHLRSRLPSTLRPLGNDVIRVPLRLSPPPTFSPAGSEVIGVAVESGCRYHASAEYPDVIHAGVRVARVGGSSIRYEVGMFRNDEDQACAEGFFVHVMVARETMRPVAVPEGLRAFVESLRL